MTSWTLTSTDGKTVAVEIEPHAIVPDVSAAHAAIVRGAGIGCIPDYLAAPSIARGELVRVLATYKPESVEAHALYPSHRSLSAKVRVFIDALIAHMIAQRPT